MPLEQDYMENAKRFGARVGDSVTIIQSYESHTYSWCNCWDREMDRYIGQTGKIIKDGGTRGMQVDFDDNYNFKFWFPWCCMKIIR